MSLDIKTVKNYAYSLFNQAKRESKENKVFESIKVFSEVLRDFSVIKNMLCYDFAFKKIHFFNLRRFDMSGSFIPKCRIGIKRHRKCDCTSPPKNKSVERIQLQQDTWTYKHTWNKRKNEITKRWHSTGCTCPSFCAPLSSVWTRGRWLGAVAYSRPLGPSLLPKKPATRPGPCLAAVSQPTP